MKKTINHIGLLDCTLRDGGHVNNACFGSDAIIGITEGLAKSGIEFVELGFLKNGTFSVQQSLYNDVTEIYPTLPESYPCNFCVMIRPDWYDIRQLSNCDGRIGTIRFAFYNKDFDLLQKYGNIVRNKGYRFICNPVHIMGYTNQELIELVKKINDLHPEQMTIVDTYGSMNLPDLERIYSLIENNLDKDIRIGIHLHENMSLAYGLAQEFIRIKPLSRCAIIDGSLYGIGRIPGNLCIEILANHFNSNDSASYNTDIIYELIGKYIEPIKKNIPWGYSPAYYMTAFLNMHRSYAEYLLKKQELSMPDIHTILKSIDVSERKLFNEKYVTELYNNYKKRS